MRFQNNASLLRQALSIPTVLLDLRGCFVKGIRFWVFTIAVIIVRKLLRLTTCSLVDTNFRRDLLHPSSN
jgi:hypothetical protein